MSSSVEAVAVDDDRDDRVMSDRCASLPTWGVSMGIQVEGNHECVLQLVNCNQGSMLAAATSSETVRVYDSTTLKQLFIMREHTDAIRALRVDPDSSSLMTASEDGTWKMTDLRSGRVHSTVKAAESLYSLDCNGRVVAAGCDIFGDVLLWDLRHDARPLGLLDEFHTEEVRELRFHPLYRSMLLSGSVDCLVNQFDLNAATLDDALVSVYNTNQSIRSFNFFGAGAEFIYCISEIETMSLLSLVDNEIMGSFEDICATLSNDLSCRYLVDCHFDAASQRLCVFAGNYYGDLMAAFVSCDAVDPALTLNNGHNEGVRAMCAQDGRFFTAGEDARILCWQPIQ